MLTINELFKNKLSVANVGLESFYDSMIKQNVQSVQVEWKPPAGGDNKILEILSKLNDDSYMDKIEMANKEALNRINRAEPELVDIKYAKDIFPCMEDKMTIGHAGPPLLYEDMCGPMKGAILGAILYEHLADNLIDAEKIVLDGKIKLVSNHSIGAVGPMTGMITHSMPLYEVKNTAFGNYAYCTFNEGLGNVLRFGANGPEVIERLRWMESSLAPALKKCLSISGPIPLKIFIAKALSMGDEMHQRNVAASSIFVRYIATYLVRVVDDKKELEKIMDFISNNDQVFLNLAMAAGKATMDPVKNIPYSTVVTAMSRNGTNFGIKVSALGDQWFEAPVEMPKGLYFPGFSEKDANPDMGDSAICETFGIGGFAMGSAPAVVRFVGVSSAREAENYTKDMAEITVGQSLNYIMPNMDFIGTPTGIDIRKVVETGILPVINTGMAHKKPGIGQVGAGIVNAPMNCFFKSIYAFAEYDEI